MPQTVKDDEEWRGAVQIICSSTAVVSNRTLLKATFVATGALK